MGYYQGNTAGITDHIASVSAVHGINNTAQLMTTVNGQQETFLNIGNSGAAFTVALSAANVQQVTLTAATTATFNNAGPITMDSVHQYSFQLNVLQDATGSRTVVWPASVTWLTGNPSVNPTASALTIFSFYTDNAGTTWYGQQITQAAAPLYGSLLGEVGDPLWWGTAANTLSASTSVFMRVPVNKAGVINDLSVGSGSAQSGAFDLGVYKLVNSTTLSALYRLGPTNSTTALTVSQWNNPGAGSTGVTVNYGDDIWLALGCDNATAVFWRKNNVQSSVPTLPTAYAVNGSSMTCGVLSQANGGWSVLGLPSTFAVSLLSNGNQFAVLGRIV